MSLAALPTEVIEQILIAAAASGFPHVIAAFAQTCKPNRDLVYDTKDQHLWREIFLTTFDDPRASGGGPGWGECVSRKQDELGTGFDWEAEFKRRVWAADYLRHQTDPTYRLQACPVTETDATLRNTRAFDALLSVVCTALPCPPTIVFSFPPPSGSPDTSPLTPSTNYPTFPPLQQAIGGLSKNIVTTVPSSKCGQISGQAQRARNTAWFDSVLEKGFPPEVTMTFSADRWEGGLANQFLDRDRFEEMQAAGHIIACTGFVPVSQPLADMTRAPSPYGTEDSPVDMSAHKQLQRARRLARMRAYNLRYLARDRHWGPFLRTETTPKRPPPRRHTVDDDDLIQPILALFRINRGHVQVHLEHDEELEDDDENDADYDPENEHTTDGNSTEDGEQNDEEDDSDSEMTLGVPEDDTGEAHDFGPVGPNVSIPPPTSAQLRVDWAYISAVRVVVEANLRESFHASDLRGLFSLDGLRRGSAPLDVSAYKMPAATENDPVDAKGKGKDVGEVQGWDWAGVTGVWMRCVCWLDYRDLLLHNLTWQLSGQTGQFEDPHLQEAVRIICMKLRIVSYSPSDVPGYTHLPTIHVVGETTPGTIAGRARKLHGMVSVIADGSVRWTLYSTVEGGDMDEWVSEGVQVGGVASAMGVLGLWTGANHDRIDPLGPCWAWKVG